MKTAIKVAAAAVAGVLALTGCSSADGDDGGTEETIHLLSLIHI